MNLACKLLWRDWRSGKLNILLFSLVLAVATITSISLFSSRIKNAIGNETAELLAGDAKISSALPIGNDWRTAATESGLNFSETMGFRAMAFSSSGTQLTAVKAVSNRYPLVGKLTIADQPFGTGSTIQHGPAEGTVWLASRLFAALNIELGDTISIGSGDFTVTQALIQEPDSPMSFFGVAPRALIHINDTTKTQAVQPGSRVNYTLAFTGSDSALKEFRQWAEPKLGDHYQWVDAKNSNRNIGKALDKAENFLLLAGCLSVILTGTAIALSARRFANRHSQQVVLFKTLGKKSRDIGIFYFTQILLLGLFGIFLGVFAGYLLHLAIIFTLGDLLPANLAAPALQAYSTGVIVGLVSLFAFAAPPLLSLRKIPPVKILQQPENSQTSSSLSTAAIGFLAISLVIFWFGGFNLLTVALLFGFIVVATAIGVVSWSLIQLAPHLAKHLAPAWKLGITNLHRHKAFSIMQVMVFAIILMLIFILLFVRTGLLDEWQKNIPENTPNHFIFNIFDTELTDIKERIQRENLDSNPFYPMTRGRVVTVNGTPIKSILENTDSQMNYKRELNLTWTQDLGNDNKIVDGKWHNMGTTANNEILVSAEQEYARGLNLKLGDTLQFSIGGTKFDAKLSSIRSVNWDSMNPNFFMIFNTPVTPQAEANWLTSLYLPPNKKLFINQITTRYPSLSVIEVDQIIAQIRGVIHRITQAIEFIFLLTLVSGITVFITSIQATLDNRKKESAILSALGANKSMIQQHLLIEFIALGGISGLLAASGSELALYFIQTHLFSLSYSVHWSLWLTAIPTGATLVALIGSLSSRSVIRTSPMTILRRS